MHHQQGADENQFYISDAAVKDAFYSHPLKDSDKEGDDHDKINVLSCYTLFQDSKVGSTIKIAPT